MTPAGGVRQFHDTIAVPTRGKGLVDSTAEVRAAIRRSGIRSGACHLLVSLTLPVREGAPRLGTWQGVYVAEHRDRPQSRDVAIHVVGE